MGLINLMTEAYTAKVREKQVDNDTGIRYFGSIDDI